MITSTKNQMIKDLIKLKQKKYRTDYYLVESMHLVEEAIKAKQAVQIITTDETLDLGIDTIVVSREVMEKLAFTKTPQNVMAKCTLQQCHDIVEGNRYLLLDNLQDPGNIGTLIRTALAFSIDQVIMSKQCVDLYNDKLLRSMQGAHFHMPIVVEDLETVIPVLQKQGICVVGSALENGQPIDTINKAEKMAYILGNEGNGMSSHILAMCDQIAYIPISTIESLNVAVAGSIMMYHFK